MKLRILITPLMIALIIYSVVWVAIPLYAGPEGVVMAREKLHKSVEKLSDITLKEENADNLVAELNSGIDQQKTLWQYLPEKKMDEEVIANISSIASRSGVFLSSVNLQEEEIAKDVLNEKTEPVEGIDVSKVEAKNFQATVILMGDYEKMRQFIVELSKLKRFNDIVSLKIAKNDSANTNTGSLQMNMVVKFNYLDKIGSIEKMSSDVFSKGKFDMGIVEAIKNKTSLDVLKVEAGSAGRSNPFSAS